MRRRELLIKLILLFMKKKVRKSDLWEQPIIRELEYVILFFSHCNE